MGLDYFAWKCYSEWYLSIAKLKSPQNHIFLTEKNHNADGYFIRTIDKMSKFDKVVIFGIHDFSKTNWNKVWSGIIKAMISADIF